jgi:hypothetical protein
VLLGSTGPWTSEAQWQWPGLLGWIAGNDPQTAPSAWYWTPVSPLNEQSLLTEVAGDIPGLNLPADDLRTDGRPYLFSALRPLAPPEGTLHVVTMDQNTLSLAILAIVLAGGFVLLPARAPRRWLAAGFFIVALVFLGVFLPTFSLQVMNAVLAAAIGLVLLMWLVRYVAYTRPRDPLVKARREALLAFAAQRAAAARAQPASAGVATFPRSTLTAPFKPRAPRSETKDNTTPPAPPSNPAPGAGADQPNPPTE